MNKTVSSFVDILNIKMFLTLFCSVRHYPWNVLAKCHENPSNLHTFKIQLNNFSSILRVVGSWPLQKKKKAAKFFYHITRTALQAFSLQNH